MEQVVIAGGGPVGLWLAAELRGCTAPRSRSSWISGFGNAARRAAACREGRVLLAGDAAHVADHMSGPWRIPAVTGGAGAGPPL